MSKWKLASAAAACVGLLSTQALANGTAVPTMVPNSAPNPSQYGQTIALGVTMSGGAGVPTGRVSFNSEQVLLRSCLELELAPSGTGFSGAHCFAYLPIGTYQIAVTYAGDANYQATTVTYTHVVGGQYGSQIRQEGPTKSAVGEPRTLNAIVSRANDAHSSAPVPTGSVNFTLESGASVPGCGAVAVNEGTATCTYVPTTTGTSAIKATYSGDTLFAASQTAPVTYVTTGAAQPKIALDYSTAATPNVLLRATVGPPPGGSAPTGTVTFRELTMWSLPEFHNPIPGCVDLPLQDGIATCSATPIRTPTTRFAVSYSGDATYRHGLATIDYPALGRPVATDLDNDGKSDILWYHTGTFGLVRMASFGAPAQIVDVQDDANWKVAGVGDFDGDRKADIVWRNDVTGSVYGLLMDGSTVRAESLLYQESDLAWRLERVADLSGDGKADLVWHNRVTGDVYVMLMNGLTMAAGQVVYSEPNQDWKILGAGDLNGDGKADLLWRNQATGDVFAMLMDGFAVIGGGVIYSEPNQDWKIVGLADFNSDGRADILWRNSATGDVFQMQMNGTTVSAGQVIYGEPDQQWRIAALGDYNGDGQADIVWRHGVTGQVYLMLMNGFAIIASDLVYTEPDQGWRIVGP